MFDLFLGGPWEVYCTDKWKSLIRSRFPVFRIYDPEEHQSDNWFDKNYEALITSQIMVVYVPEFPCPGVGPEIGIYYQQCKSENRKVRLIVIWPDTVQPQYGKEVLSKIGLVVSNCDEAITILHGILSGVI